MKTLLKAVFVLLLLLIVGPILVSMVFGLLAVALPNFLAAAPAQASFIVSSPLSWAPFLIPLLSLLPLVLVLALAFFAVRWISKEGADEGGGFSADETRIMQEIYHRLSDMEKRVEALETILLDRARSEETYKL